MMLKPIIPLLLISVGVSACGILGGDKEKTPMVSKSPQVVKTSLKSASKQVETAVKATKCDDKGFCPLPGLKRRPKP